jgi:hypothetical protein
VGGGRWQESKLTQTPPRAIGEGRPKVARLDAPGVLHHIMIRGIERGKIFLNSKDYEDFRAKRLGMSSPGVGYAVERGEPLVREGKFESTY